MKSIFLFLLLFLTISGFTQDVLTFKTGEEIQVKVVEVLQSEIKYKKWDNLDGPIYEESKMNIFMIKYKNGSKDIFSEIENNTPTVSNSVNNTNPKIKLQDKYLKLSKHYKNRGITSSIIGPIFLVAGITSGSIFVRNYEIDPVDNTYTIFGLVGGICTVFGITFTGVGIPVCFTKSSKYNKLAKGMTAKLSFSPVLLPVKNVSNNTNSTNVGIRLAVNF